LIQLVFNCQLLNYPSLLRRRRRRHSPLHKLVEGAPQRRRLRVVDNWRRSLRVAQLLDEELQLVFEEADGAVLGVGGVAVVVDGKEDTGLLVLAGLDVEGGVLDGAVGGVLGCLSSK